MADTIIEAGVHNYTGAEDYVPEKNPLVQEHIEWFRDQKLGFMMHWAPVTQLGLTESWPLSAGDADWSRTEIDWTDDMDAFCDTYWKLNRTFNPVKFRPDRWAALARECGFKYLLFTTKHHDGFCMYDSKYTDYKVTSPDCPFSENPRANIVREMFDAFRKEGLGISAYFSKPDWHSDDYWHKAFGPAKDRNVNYDVTEHPEIWERFVQFTQKQLTEIGTDYGKIDALWLDGGWVRPDNKGQDIRLGEVVEKLRATTQPDLVVCDRTVGGPYENIVTPEMTLPSEPMDVPWEACITLGRHFSFHYEDTLKSARELVRLLLDVVSRGGNLALNITPQPDGDLPRAAVARLRELGGWLAQQNEGIYASRISQSRESGNIRYTHKPDTEYAYFLHEEVPYLPPVCTFSIERPVARVRLLRTGEELPFTQNGSVVEVRTETASRMGMAYADGFAFDAKA